MRVANRVAAELDLPVQIPTPIREVGFPPVFVDSGDEPLLREVVAGARRQLEHGRSVGVICAEDSFVETGNAFTYEGIAWGDGRENTRQAVTLVPAHAAKGLEFDAVVIVDPEAIIESTPQGLNLLFVAVTRTTTSLTVVYKNRLPTCLAEFGSPAAGSSILPLAGRRERQPAMGALETEEEPLALEATIIEHVANRLAQEIERVITPDSWDTLVSSLRDALQRRQERP
jgi:hypothetical protein